jgi:pyridoxine/pyridoxamine 5'-phosphate oxidase
MSETTSPTATQEQQVDRLLDAARKTIAEVRYCWVVTQAEDGGANARIVRDCSDCDGDALSARWFLAQRGSRKSAEIRRTGRVTLAYQHQSGSAYVTLAGQATLIDDQETLAARLRLLNDPDILRAARLFAVRVSVDHMEPWGHGRTLLDRDRHGAWRLQPD